MKEPNAAHGYTKGSDIPTEQEIKAYLNYEDVQKELEEAKAIIKELKLALITRDGNLTNKVMFEELTRLRSELQQKDEWIKELVEVVENYVDLEKLAWPERIKSLIKKAKLNN